MLQVQVIGPHSVAAAGAGKRSWGQMIGRRVSDEMEDVDMTSEAAVRWGREPVDVGTLKAPVCKRFRAYLARFHLLEGGAV